MILERLAISDVMFDLPHLRWLIAQNVAVAQQTWNGRFLFSDWGSELMFLQDRTRHWQCCCFRFISTVGNISCFTMPMPHYDSVVVGICLLFRSAVIIRFMDLFCYTQEIGMLANLILQYFTRILALRFLICCHVEVKSSATVKKCLVKLQWKKKENIKLHSFLLNLLPIQSIWNETKSCIWN